VDDWLYQEHMERAFFAQQISNTRALFDKGASIIAIFVLIARPPRRPAGRPGHACMLEGINLRSFFFWPRPGLGYRHKFELVLDQMGEFSTTSKAKRAKTI
jgi:hypothetical protein